jgi:hypothetical protein
VPPHREAPRQMSGGTGSAVVRKEIFLHGDQDKSYTSDDEPIVIACTDKLMSISLSVHGEPEKDLGECEPCIKHEAPSAATHEEVRF